MGKKKSSKVQKQTSNVVSCNGNHNYENKKEEPFVLPILSVLQEMHLTLIDAPTQQELNLFTSFPKNTLRQIICSANCLTNLGKISYKMIQKAVIRYLLGEIQFSDIVSQPSTSVYFLAIQLSALFLLRIKLADYYLQPHFILALSLLCRSNSNYCIIPYDQKHQNSSHPLSDDQLSDLNFYIVEKTILFDKCIIVGENELKCDNEVLNELKLKSIEILPENVSIIDEYFHRAITILQENKVQLTCLTNYLFAKKEIYFSEIYQILEVNIPDFTISPQLDTAAIVPIDISESLLSGSHFNTNVFPFLDLMHRFLDDQALKDCDPSIQFQKSFLEGKLLVKQAILTPQNGPWKNIPFKIQLSFPTEYPFLYPSPRFTNICFHPNVHFVDGTMYVPCIHGEEFALIAGQVEGSKGKILESMLKGILKILEEPEEESVLNKDAWELYQKNPRRCEQLVQSTYQYIDRLDLEEAIAEFYTSTLKINPFKPLRDIFLPLHVEETKQLHIPRVSFLPSESTSRINVDIESIQGPYQGHTFHFTLSFAPNYPDTYGAIYLREPTKNLFHPQMLCQTAFVLPLSLPKQGKTQRKDKNWIELMCRGLAHALNINSFQEASRWECFHYPILFYYHPSFYSALVEHSLSPHANYLPATTFQEEMEEIVEVMKKRIELQAKKDKVNQTSIVITYDKELGTFDIIPSNDSSKKKNYHRR